MSKADVNARFVTMLARASRWLAAGAAALAFGAFAAPPPGTTISNQASASGISGATAVGNVSNTVTLVTSAPVFTGSFMLTASDTKRAAPGATLVFRHALTNTGAAADSYSLTVADLPGTFAATGFAIYPDVNADGVPDGPAPLAGPVSLAPGQTFTFVVEVLAPGSAAPGTQDQFEVRASSLSPGATTPAVNVDTIQVVAAPPPEPQDGLSIFKFLSVTEGPSPFTPVRVTIRWSNSNFTTSGKTNFTVADTIPDGFDYVPGSARWSGASAPLTDGAGGDPPGAAYDFGITEAGAVTLRLSQLAVAEKGELTFNLSVKPGRATGDILRNTARYLWTDSRGVTTPWRDTNEATYRVTGTVAVTLVGETLPTAEPGSTVFFRNTLTNTGTIAETFEITLGPGDFPPGTLFTLLKADAVTPLPDTNGNRTPDTGVVAPGTTQVIVVRAVLPTSTPPGAYRIAKNATAASAPSARASDDDRIGAVTVSCRVVIEPDLTGHVAVSASIVYPHAIRNVGNCAEEITFPTAGKSGAKSDSVAGWTSQPFLDNPVPGPVSLVGVLDTGDEPITTATRFTLQPGQFRTLLVRVTSPDAPTPEVNLTVSRAVASITGPLSVTDRTTNTRPGGTTIEDVIRNYTDTGYQVETIWGVIGRDLFLRADARSCNARPDTVETRTMLLTGPGGEREEVVATETGPDTGIFVAAGIPVSAPPVVAQDGRVQGRPNDVFEAEILGCGKRIWTLVTLIEPRSIVFDSRTNQPVSGAVVTLLDAPGGRCSTTPATVRTISGGQAVSSPNPVTTGADGRFDFPLASAGSYCLSVKPPNGYRFASEVPYTNLPTGRNLNVTGPTSGGSYGTAFTIGPTAGAVVVDVPVDPVAISGLFVQKAALRSIVEVGEFVDYVVRVRNASGRALDAADVLLTDDLPFGFAYLSGTARRGGTTIADPEGQGGPRLVFRIGRMKVGEEALISYRVRVGPGATRGDGVNQVQAQYTAFGVSTTSNVATAKVLVSAGVFSDRGYILGRVFQDCNANGVQDGGERGVPGVRLYLEDGTNAITDGEGKYSLYGITNRTHVLKADRTTLPAGSTLAVLSSRHGGDPASRFVDLKSGELLRADFAISTCGEAIDAEIAARREAFAKLEQNAEMLVSQKLEVERTPIADVKALPAAGLLGVAPGTGNPALAGGQAGFQPVEGPLPRLFEKAPMAATPTIPGGFPAGVAPPAPQVDLENLVPDLDPRLGFVGLSDKDTLPYAQSTIRVKGPAGTTFRLFVNNAEVPANRVGKRAVLAEKGVQAWEYIGVNLSPGLNNLAVAVVDPFGNERGREEIVVTAPDKLGRLEIELPPGGAVADGRSAARIGVRLMDAAGVPVTVRTPVTLEANRGQWRTADLDRNEPGVQVFIEGGRGEFELSAPIEPGDARIRVSSGPLKADAVLAFLPEMRPFLAVGVIEGTINLRNIDPRSLLPSRETDGFEQEIRQFSRTSDDGKTEAGARASFFLKGQVKGDVLLTAAYDSDKPTRERLFRDIQPDEFYPVYGDASLRGFDAQSTSRFYVRVDKQKSYLLYGDFTTQEYSDARKISTYTRSLTGARAHYENGRVSANVFASKDSTRQQIDEIRANGTSGPYTLSSATGLVNSERVEILTRDRSQPSIVLQSTPQARFFDYEIEPLTGRILFKAPVPSVDPNLNPISIRVTYEVETGGPDFWVGGIDAQVKVTDRLEVGGTYVEDRNPNDPFTLKGVNATVRLFEKTYVFAEAARAEREKTSGAGDAARLEIRHEGKDLQASAFIARTDAGFDNPGAYIGKGRGESGAKAQWKAGERTTVRGEVLRTEDVSTNAVRDGLAASVEQRFENQMAVELGVRHARENNGPAIPVGSLGVPSAGVVPDEVTTARARLTGPVPFLPGATIYGEGEVDVEDADRRILALGGEYAVPGRGKAYFRHEFVSSITGPYGLNAKERQNTTVFGVDTDYMKDGRLFSEYRVRDALSGGDTEAAIGLRNTWTLREGLRLGTSLERVHALSGNGDNENTAVALGLEYTANPLWKASTRLEVRDAATGDSGLFTIGFASRLAPDWTLLARNTFSIQRNKAREGADPVAGLLGDTEKRLERFQAGLAWRDSQNNDKDLLARIEHREERDDTQAGITLKRSTQILSVNASWQPRRPFLVSGRYAAKWANENSLGLTSKYTTQLVGGRITWEFAPKWDVGLVSNVLFGGGFGTRQYGVGVELGYLVSTNLWVSAGYNFFGYKDEDLAGGDTTTKGPYVRLRYKFDEQVFDQFGLGRPEKAAAPTPSPVASR